MLANALAPHPLRQRGFAQARLREKFTCPFRRLRRKRSSAFRRLSRWGAAFFSACSFSASDLVRFDESLDVARNKPDEFAEPHEWDRSLPLCGYLECSQGYVDSFSRLYPVQQAVAGIVSCIVMPCVACQPADFTFYLFMAGHPLLSVGQIAKETGLTRQRIWQLAVTGGIPAKRANPNGKQHRFYDSAEFAAWRKEKARQSARPRGSQVRRAGGLSN